VIWPLSLAALSLVCDFAFVVWIRHCHKRDAALADAREERVRQHVTDSLAEHAEDLRNIRADLESTSWKLAD
jgi:hypothetical protein